MPDNVDTSSYDAIVSIVFWAAGIIIASASMVPGFHAMSEGKANEDKRGFNSGLTAVIVGAVCSIACVAVRYIFSDFQKIVAVHLCMATMEVHF